MKKHKILIVDDDKALRAAIGIRLNGWGYSVAESSDGLGAISQYLREGVDAIILDYEIPNGDGQTIARMLRNETDVPIVFVSGHKREEFRSVIMALSDVYYLSKPIDDSHLRDLLEQIFSSGCVPSVGG